MSLIVTGSIGIDTVITPHGRADKILGGSCTYFCAAASFFTPVRLVAAVGDDFPREFLKVFDHFHVDTAGLEIRKGAKTFAWTGQYHDNMNDRDTLEVHPNILAEALPPVPQTFRNSQYVFLANTHPAAQMDFLGRFPNKKLVVADTMDLWIKTAHAELLALLKKIDGLVLNDSEAYLLTGEKNLVKAAQKVLAMGPSFVVIKKGEHGCLLEHRDGRAMLPAFPIADVIDPTGAGDSFAGGLMGHLAATGDLSLSNIRQAVAVGAVVASFTVEAFSLEKLQSIKKADIDRRLTQYTNMLQFVC
ncbi:MAG: sugar kinase [Phycisphaeraceae bacterium]|nr:sugar kinase [Phycisphaeraceae bacterium]